MCGASCSDDQWNTGADDGGGDSVDRKLRTMHPEVPGEVLSETERALIEKHKAELLDVLTRVSTALPVMITMLKVLGFKSHEIAEELLEDVEKEIEFWKSES